MANAKEFAMWFLTNLPDFLMSEPIVYIVGLFILSTVISLMFRIMHVNK